MKSIFIVLVAVSLSVSFAGYARSDDLTIAGAGASPCTVMHPDWDTLMQRQEAYRKLPTAYIDKEMDSELSAARREGRATSLSLLGYLSYIPKEREQGSCGDCWAWASTGVLEVAQSVQEGVPDRNSVQFLNSCKTDKYACKGGGIDEFAEWYATIGYSVPWSNSHGSFKDGSKKCGEGSSSCVRCSAISTNPQIAISTIAAEQVPTQDVGQETAISNIKNVLGQNKAVLFGFDLADAADWTAFRDFWHDNPETTVWNPDSYCGKTYGKGGGGHDVLIVGYNDDDPANPYWIILNSWGNAKGERPNGLFRMAMNMNYDCTLDYSGTTKYTRSFLTLNVAFPSCTYALTPSTPVTYNSGGGNSTIKIIASAPVCPAPTVTPNVSWLHASSSTLSYNNGKGTLKVKADANTGSKDLNGSVTIGNAAFEATLKGKPCTLKSLSPSHASFNNGDHETNLFTVATSPADCTWTAQADSGWVHVITGSGAGGDQVTYNVDANPGKPRTGKINVTLDAKTSSKKTFTVTQTNKPPVTTP